MFWNVIWPICLTLFSITMFFVNVRLEDTPLAVLWAGISVFNLIVLRVGLSRVQRRKEALSED